MGDKEPSCVASISVEINELKAMIKGQNKRIDQLIKKIDDDCKQHEPHESTMKNINPYLECLNPDVLYHLNLSTETTDFEKVFGDVRFVVLGGTEHRMKKFAVFIMKEIGISMNSGVQLKNISEDAHRYAMYKVGPILCASHGIGGPSIGILLHEIIKIMHYAKCQNPIFFRLGTCGGICIEPGTVIITTQPYDGQMRPVFEIIVQTSPELRPAILDEELANELMGLTDTCVDGFQTITGKTFCTNDFYEGQSRLDGAFCKYTPESKKAFIEKLHGQNIVNIEMESTVFAALTHQAGIRAAVLTVAIVNRMEGDQISSSHETLGKWSDRPAIIIARYIRKVLYGEDDDNACECLV